MWPPEVQWRAPIGDFPPPWASAWGDDPYGLWADLTVNGATQRMRWIEPSGPEDAWIGEGDDARLQVITFGFWLADTPCTQAFWQAVTGQNPSHFKYGAEAPERPVEMVSWEEVQDDFITLFARTPEWGTVERLCLPSELEWEYAARAGTRTAYWWGDGWDEARGNANVSGKRKRNDPKGTTPVKRYGPNPWGLYDVHGNVWEWCNDVWRDRLIASEERFESGDYVVRGGSWFYHSGFARAAYRGRRHRRRVSQSLGFRFALRSPSGPEARPGGAG